MTELRENTFYASITLQVNGREVEIDSRPSDALALAVRTSAPIFAAEDVIAESAIEFEHEDENEEQVVDKFKEFLDNVTPEDFMEEGGEGPASCLTAIATMRSRKSGAQIRSATPTASAPATSARESGGGVAADPLEVVADRERLRRRAEVAQLEPVVAEQARQARAREVVDVGRDHRPPPRAHHARDAAARVGQHQHHAAAGREQAAHAVERRAGVGQVLDHVAQHDRLVLAGGQRRPSSGRRSARRGRAARGRSRRRTRSARRR